MRSPRYRGDSQILRSELRRSLHETGAHTDHQTTLCTRFRMCWNNKQRWD